MSKSGVFSIKKWLVFVVIVILTGCSSNRLPNIEVIDQASIAQSRKSSQTPQEALTLAEQDIETANKEALEYFAPIHLSLAEKYLKNAHSLFLKENDAISVIAETIKVRKVIAGGLSTKQSVLRQLSDLFKMKERLDQLKTEVYFRDDYEDQLDNIKKLIRYIEKGDQEAFDKKKSVYLGKMLALEIDVVKKKTLSEPLQIFKNAKRLDAKKIAPKTWKTAEDTLTQARVFIESFPRDEAGVEKAGLDALRACQHAYFVTKEVQHIKEIDEDDIENLVLEVESKLNRITLALNHEDVRYMSLHDQSVALGNAAEILGRNLIVCNRKEITTQAPGKTVSELDSVNAEEETLNNISESVSDETLQMEKSSGEIQVLETVSELRTPAAEPFETETIGAANENAEDITDDTSDDIIPAPTQEPEVAETLASDSISEKQEPISTEPDGSEGNDPEVIKDDINDKEEEDVLSGTNEKTGTTSDSDGVDSMGPGEEAPEIKPEAEEIVPDTAQLTEPHALANN